MRVVAYDPDPAGVRAIHKLLTNLPPDTVARFCNAINTTQDSVVDDVKRALAMNDIDEAWKNILEAKFLKEVSELCTVPPAPMVPTTPIGLDTKEMVSTDLVEDIGQGIRGIGQGISQIPLALIVLAGAIIGGAILISMMGD